MTNKLQIVPQGEREIVVCTEHFDSPWNPGEGLVTATFVESAGTTTLTVTMRYESTAARDGVLASPMETSRLVRAARDPRPRRAVAGHDHPAPAHGPDLVKHAAADTQ